MKNKIIKNKMPKIQFYLLDVDYKIVDEKPQVWLYGKLSNGKKIIAIDDSYIPYFYIILNKDVNKNKFVDKIKKVVVERRGSKSFVTKAEFINKKFFNKDVEAIKVYVNIPPALTNIRNEIKEWKDIKYILEYDISFVIKYLIDNNLTPLNLVEVDAEQINIRARTSVIKVKSIKQITGNYMHDFNILGFDIETYNPRGKFVDPEKDPIVMVSFFSKNFKKVITWKKFKTNLDYIEFVDGEAELIDKFKEIINDVSPDILVGYFSKGFDLPYIRKRADKYRIKLDIGIDYSVMQFTRNDIKIFGIMNLDILEFIQRVVSQKLETDVLTLDAVAKEILNEGKENVEIDKLAYVWDKHPENLEPFCKYNLQDSMLTYKLCEKLLPNIIELTRIVGLPLCDVSNTGYSQLVEWYLIRRAKDFNELVPERPHKEETDERRGKTYKGAFVYQPKPGLYKNVVILDFRSLYPSIMISHNISPETLRMECDNIDYVPENKDIWFCKKIKGFIPKVIEEIVTRRMRVKEIMKKVEGRKRILLDARQQSLKVLSNSFYGYLGFFAARWYNIDCARAVTAYGRYYIHKVIDEANKNKFTVIYSDTDSIFVALGDKKKKDAIMFADSINRKLPKMMELEFQGFYNSGLFVSMKESETGAKKKYALLDEDGKIHIKGFEAVRRNWSIIGKEVQQRVFDIILKEEDVEKALNYVKDIIKKLKDNKVDLQKVIIFTQLQKDISSYESIGPHVAVAKRMKRMGYPVGPGSIIKYIIVKGGEKIRDRARLINEVKQNNYDGNYYINHQIIPAVERIFNIFGYTKEDLLGEKKQSKLGKFLG